MREATTNADAWHLYGVSLAKLGDYVAAERPVRQAIAINPQQPAYHLTLADLLWDLGWPERAIESYRTALKLAPSFMSALRQLTLRLTSLGRSEEALALIGPVASANGQKEIGLLNAHAAALKGAQRLAEALAVYRRIVALAPGSPEAHHNLAAALGDAGEAAEAEVSAANAIARGSSAPETRLVRARALLQLGRIEDAEEELRRAVSLRPGYVEAQRDLAQLVWMRSENSVLALQPLREVPAGARTPSLRLLEADLMAAMGDARGAFDIISSALEAHENDVTLLLSAAQSALLVGEPEAALEFSRRAAALAAADAPEAQTVQCEVLLALGRASEAAGLAESLALRFPNAQQPLAYLATAWRLLDDPRAKILFDYDRLVRADLISAPAGWRERSDYLIDLAAELHVRHRFRTHPIGQSVRNGSQVSNVLTGGGPALKAFPEAIDPIVRGYIASLAGIDSVFASRSRAAYAFSGIWSVKLRPGDGRHVDHIHPEGWISSACYIELPSSVDEGSTEGWIRFGEPGIPTRPKLEAERRIRPEPGLLVLFPSYMWHGTEAFFGGGNRMTIAFDLVPA